MSPLSCLDSQASYRSTELMMFIRPPKGRRHETLAALRLSGETPANRLNLPVEFVLYPNSGQVTDAVESGAVDVGFMPVDEQRRKRLAIGPDYVRAESTYMVTAASGAKTVDDVDKPGMRVIGIANTTTIRAAERMLRNTTIS